MTWGIGQRHINPIGILLLLAASAASIFSFPVFAESEEGILRLRMVGNAEGTGFEARHAALQDARQDVIWEILKTKIASGDLRPFRSMVRNADKYITRVVELHLDSDGGQTRVEIDAYVDIQAVEHDLATLMLPRLATPPTVTCLIALEDEKGGLFLEEPGLAETTMVEGLKKLGIVPSTHLESSAQYAQEDLRAALTGDLEKAAAYVKETLADAVVLGIVHIERGPDLDQGGTAKTRATLDARIFRGSDGDLLEVFARSAAITGKDATACQEEAITDTATKMLGDITVTTVLSVLSTQKKDEVLITLHNPGSRSRVEALMGLLGQDTAVNSIEESFFSERLARLRVGYEGPMAYIVDQISSHSYEDWTVEVQQVIGREMNLMMVPGKGSGK
jgi:hypothetical protein